MKHYELGKVPRILVGSEAVQGLGALVRSLGGESAALVVDSVLERNGYLETLSASLDLPQQVYVVPPGEPSVEVVNAASQVAQKLSQPVVIGVGGGSALDTAKQAAGVMAGLEPIQHYLLCAHPWPGRRPIIAIPTTSGTGAEVTRTCIVSDTQGRKLWTWGDELLPDVVILDPQATLTLPAGITATTGLDALVHALEASTGQRRNAISSGIALQAIRLVLKYLPRAVQEPSHLEARQGMQEAALLAGMAIDNCGTGIAHSIGHALGTLYHLPHGVAVTLALQAALGWNLEAQPEVYTEVAGCFGIDVARLSGAFEELLTEVRFDQAVRALPNSVWIARDIAQTMIATENQPMWKNNVRLADQAERLWLAQKTVTLWDGYRSAVRG